MVDSRIRFIYFDLGKVLLDFDHRRGCRQMAAVAGIDDPEIVWRAVHEGPLHLEFESGRFSAREFHEEFCRRTNTRPDFDALSRAAGDIFEPRADSLKLLSALKAAGNRVGLLSNTNVIHWNWFASGRYPPIPEIFDAVILSYESRACKPQEKIFHDAIALAGCRPEEIFYMDDTLGHVEAARRLGIVAEHFTTASPIVARLRELGVPFEY